MTSGLDFFRGRRVLVTGHTGFKGSWLLLWLRRLGAEVTGYSLAATSDSMYARLQLDSSCRSIIGDVRDRRRVAEVMAEVRPEVVLHLAAQALVLPAYDDPITTIETNVVGTANLLEAVRTTAQPCTVIVVTSDKCYENHGWVYSYREIDPLGGHDPYSASKAAAEIITASYRRSFFGRNDVVRVASVRAGNVIGGGDWAANRIVPDCMRALYSGEVVTVHNPGYTRPWQHVLDPLSGYLQLAARIGSGDTQLCEAWNFAPSSEDVRTVGDMADAVIRNWGSGSWTSPNLDRPHEARTLQISAEKARTALGWRPRWSFESAVEQTVSWYARDHRGASAEELRDYSSSQIETYEGSSRHDG